LGAEQNTLRSYLLGDVPVAGPPHRPLNLRQPRWLVPHRTCDALYLEPRGLPAHPLRTRPVHFGQGGGGPLGDPVGDGRSICGLDPLRSRCRRAPSRHHQPLRATDHWLAGLRVARDLCRCARGDVPVRGVLVVPSAQGPSMTVRVSEEEPRRGDRHCLFSNYT
jgi:hypothetical protein